MSSQNTKRKCDSCGEWNFGKPKFCQHCGDFLDHHEREIEQKEVAKSEAIAAEVAAFEAKTPVAKFFLRVGRFIYTIYMAIVSFIAWVIFWLAG
ncbi:MAG: hypothetical protein H6581_28335 [Bacteroidia bacterium]|nr:hypothetical protein [Bacteroidia bacterium]